MHPEKPLPQGDEYKALTGLSYGLYLVTTGDLECTEGMLASWVSQVSGDPLLIMAAIRENRSLLPELKRRGSFAVNLLAASQKDLATKLARPREQRFEGIDLKQGPLGLPILSAAPGFLCCRVETVTQPGDHLIMIGSVKGAGFTGSQDMMTSGGCGHTYLGLS